MLPLSSISHSTQQRLPRLDSSQPWPLTSKISLTSQPSVTDFSSPLSAKFTSVHLSLEQWKSSPSDPLSSQFSGGGTQYFQGRFFSTMSGSCHTLHPRALFVQSITATVGNPSPPLLNWRYSWFRVRSLLSPQWAEPKYILLFRGGLYINSVNAYRQSWLRFLVQHHWKKLLHQFSEGQKSSYRFHVQFWFSTCTLSDRFLLNLSKMFRLYDETTLDIQPFLHVR